MSAFICNALATILGIGLTFGTSAIIEHRHKVNVQKMSAMMLIHNMDESISRMKEDNKSDEDGLAILLDIYNHPEKLENMERQNDTVQTTAGLLSTGFRPLQFSELTEEKFSSDNSLISTLNNLQFIDNVNKFISLRKEYLAQYQFYIFDNGKQGEVKEIADRIIEKQLKEAEYDESGIDLRPVMKEMIRENRYRLLNYLSCASVNVANGKASIFEMEKLNMQNKKLMGISDSDIEKYLHRNDRKANERSIIGTWVNNYSVNSTNTLIFSKDRKVLNIVEYKDLMHSAPKTDICVTTSRYGRWKFDGRSIIEEYDSTRVTTTGKPSEADGENWTEMHEKALNEWIDGLKTELEAKSTDTLKNVIINRITEEMSVGSGSISMTWAKEN